MSFESKLKDIQEKQAAILRAGADETQLRAVEEELKKLMADRTAGVYDAKIDMFSLEKKVNNAKRMTSKRIKKTSAKITQKLKNTGPFRRP